MFGRGSIRKIARDVRCSSGTEHRLTQCSYSSITQSSSTRYEEYSSVGVICQGNTLAPTECDHGDVRLVGGQRMSEGRVEICARGYWATTCNSNWDIVETKVACKQLGLPTSGGLSYYTVTFSHSAGFQHPHSKYIGSEYVSGSPFGSNYQLPIISVSCSIRNSNLSQCSFFTQLSSCNRRNNIGIHCTGGLKQNL